MNKIILSFALVSLIGCSPDDDTLTPDPDPDPPFEDSISAGWKKISLPADMPHSNDVFFFTNTTGFLTGEPGICRSTDGGNTWQKIYRSEFPIVNIGMGSSSNAIFVARRIFAGPQGLNATRMIYTHNGGNTFDSVDIADGSVTDLCFASPTTAYAVGRKLWKTVNAGVSWSEVYTFSSTAVALTNLYFSSEQHGWVAIAGKAFKTNNGGQSWDIVNIPGIQLNSWVGLHFTDANHGFVTDDVSFVKTTNAGTAWSTPLTFLKTQAELHDVHFVNSSKGYITDPTILYKTIDGGATWTRELHVGGGLIEVHFTDANHGWVCGPSGHIWKFEQ